MIICSCPLAFVVGLIHFLSFVPACCLSLFVVCCVSLFVVYQCVIICCLSVCPLLSFVDMEKEDYRPVLLDDHLQEVGPSG